MLLLTSNPTATAVTAGGTVDLGAAIHGCGKIRLENNNIILTEPGYYEVNVSASIAVTGTGTEAIQLYANGEPITGALAYATPGAAGANVNLAFTWIVRKKCCGRIALSLVTGAAGTANDVIVAVRS